MPFYKHSDRVDEEPASIMLVTPELVGYYKRGLVTLTEATNLAKLAAVEECTCGDDLPDGRTGHICHVCLAELNNQPIPY